MKAIEFLREFKLSKSDLKGIDDDLVAALAVTSFAVSETSSLMRMYIFLTHDFTGDHSIDLANSMQRNLILRTWSAKLFEFSQFVNLKGKHNRTNCQELIDLLKVSQGEFAKLQKNPGYDLVRDLRNEAANHYCLSPAKKNLPHVSETADFSMYMHKKNGNSFYPMGEEVMFVGRVNRHVGSETSKLEKEKQYKIWMDWNLEANNWVGKTHDQIAIHILSDKFKEKFARDRAHWISPEMVGEAGEAFTPLFLRTAERKKQKE